MEDSSEYFPMPDALVSISEDNVPQLVDLPVIDQLIAKNEASLLEEGLKSGELSLRTRDHRGWLPFHWGVYLGRKDCMAVLLKLDTDGSMVCMPTLEGEGPFHLVVRSPKEDPFLPGIPVNRSEVVNFLRKHGFDPDEVFPWSSGMPLWDCREDRNRSPLGLAMLRMDVEAVDLLLRAGADVNHNGPGALHHPLYLLSAGMAGRKGGVSAASCAVLEPEAEELIRKFADLGASPSLCEACRGIDGYSDRTWIQHALAGCALLDMEELGIKLAFVILREGLDVPTTCALSRAVWSNRSRLVRVLVDELKFSVKGSVPAYHLVGVPSVNLLALARSQQMAEFILSRLCVGSMSTAARRDIILDFFTLCSRRRDEGDPGRVEAFLTCLRNPTFTRDHRQMRFRVKLGPFFYFTSWLSFNYVPIEPTLLALLLRDPAAYLDIANTLYPPGFMLDVPGGNVAPDFVGALDYYLRRCDGGLPGRKSYDLFDWLEERGASSQLNSEIELAMLAGREMTKMPIVLAIAASEPDVLFELLRRGGDPKVFVNFWLGLAGLGEKEAAYYRGVMRIWDREAFKMAKKTVDMLEFFSLPEEIPAVRSFVETYLEYTDAGPSGDLSPSPLISNAVGVEPHSLLHLSRLVTHRAMMGRFEDRDVAKLKVSANMKKYLRFKDDETQRRFLDPPKSA